MVVGARRLRHGGGGRVLYTALDDGGEATCSVEQLVLQEYRAAGGWEGLHVETGVHLALFALLLWDLLFDAPPPGAFTSRFQDAPHDLTRDPGEFAAARRVRLDARLSELRAMGGARLAAEVLTAHAAHRGVRCRGLSWERWGERSGELAELAGCLGGASLAAICECFAEDYGGWHGGMPDLIVWQRCRRGEGANGEAGEATTGGGGGDGGGGDSMCGGEGACGEGACGEGACGEGLYGEARLVEVKSPSDSLSDQQRAWIDRLASRGVLIEVCRVLEGQHTEYERLQPSFLPPPPASQPPQSTSQSSPAAMKSPLPTLDAPAAPPPSAVAAPPALVAPATLAAPPNDSRGLTGTALAPFTYKLPEPAPKGSRLRLKRKEPTSASLPAGHRAAGSLAHPVLQKF